MTVFSPGYSVHSLPTPTRKTEPCRPKSKTRIIYPRILDKITRILFSYPFVKVPELAQDSARNYGERNFDRDLGQYGGTTRWAPSEPALEVGAWCVRLPFFRSGPIRKG